MEAAEPAVRHDHHDVARFVPGDDGADDLVDRGRLPCRLAAAGEIAYQLRDGETLGLGQLRSEHRCHQHEVRASEGAREVVLKDAPARRGGTGLEHGPDSGSWTGTAQA